MPLFDKIIESATSGDINRIADPAAEIVRNGCIGLAGILLTLQVAIEIGKRFIGASQGNFSFLVKYGIMALGLLLYQPMMKTIDFAMSIPNTAIKAGTSRITVDGGKVIGLNEAMRKKEKAGQEAVIEGQMTVTPEAAKSTSIWDGLNFSGLGKTILYGIISALYDISKLVIIVIRQYLLTTLYILGPIALTLSFIQKLEGSFIGFLKYYIVFHLWITVTLTIDMVSSLLDFSSIMNTDGTQSVDGLPTFEVIIIQAGLVILNIMTPKIADILVSGSQGGAFFSAANAYLTKGVAMLTGGAGAAVGGAGSMAGKAFGGAGKVAGKIKNQ